MNLKRILAVKLADLGDALLIVPALRALKKAFPTAQLDVLTTATGQAGLSGLPYIDNILLFDKYQFDNPREALHPANLKQAASFFLDLRFKGYHAVIFFHHFSTKWGALKFRTLANATGAPLRVGLDNGAASFLNLSLSDEGFGGKGFTERDYWRELVKLLILKAGGSSTDYDERPEIAVSQAEAARADQLWQEVRERYPSKPLIAFGAGSGNYALVRRWPTNRYAQLADQLVQHYDAQIVLLGAAGEYELNEEVRTLAHSPQRLLNLAGRTNAKEAVTFLRHCQLFIGNDGGLAQLAGIAQIPSVVIFGPTNAVAWSPFGTEPDENGHQLTHLVQAQMELPCRPCLYRGKGLGSRLGCAPRPCLTTITPEQLMHIIRTVVDS